jgi:protein associated with RNAse G/E
VDLQLDVRVFADAAGALEHRLVDEDDFEAARERYGYSAELVARCRAAVEELISLIESRQFPFDA